MESPKRSELSAQLSDLEKEITEGGGLERYQEASIAGQLDTRGGDSSKVMMEWLHELMPQRTRGLRLLELGCLRIDNACSRSGFFDFIERIDLHSQHPDILEQDFMDRPLPKSDEDKFDAISCSLVVNYVPDPKVRGDMLVRTATFLRTISHLSPFPCLFLVLPAPCVRNSRYFDEKTLLNILDCIGYKLVESKETSRICYWLLKLDKKPKIKPFRKRIVNDGRNRNNFTIVLES
jgi:25S rRNA (adenine2142-N1)-methyltransferase